METRIEYLRKEIDRHNYLYYTLDKPEISDDEYDAMFKELKALEAEYPDSLVAESPTQKVGGAISQMFKPITRSMKMYSLDKSSAIESVEKFIQNVCKLSDTFVDMWVDAKLDGLAVELTYINGKLIVGSTRGDGFTGEIVTDNLLKVIGIPAVLNDKYPPSLIEIRGEVVMHKDDLVKINQVLAERNEKLLSNTRNGAAGALRQLDPEVTKSRTLHFYAYGIGRYECDNPYTLHSELLQYYKNLGFALPPHGKLCKSTVDVMAAIKEIGDSKSSFPMDCDGAVVIVDDMLMHEMLGCTMRAPRYATAFKYETAVKTTKLLEVIEQIGRSGVITPVAVYEPVEFNGAMLGRSTIHTWSEVEELDLHIGDTIQITRANEVIPKILGVDLSQRTASCKKVVTPTHCKFCGSPLRKQSEEYTKIYCSNQDCVSKKIEYFKYFVSKQGMDIRDLGSETIIKLLNDGCVSDVADIFNLNIDQLRHIGLGPVESKNIMNSINHARVNATLKSFIQSLGIPSVGSYVSGILATKFRDMSDFASVVLDECSWINIVSTSPDIGKIIAKNIESFFTTESNLVLLNKFQQYGVWPVRKTFKDVNTSLTDKNIAFTGTLSIPRDKFKKLAEAVGANISGSVTKSLDYLIVGANPSSKLDKAKAIPTIKIINEQEFMKLLE